MVLAGPEHPLPSRRQWFCLDLEGSRLQQPGHRENGSQHRSLPGPLPSFSGKHVCSETACIFTVLGRKGAAAPCPAASGARVLLWL